MDPADTWLRLAAGVDLAAYLLALGCVAIAALAAAGRVSTLANRWTWATAAVTLATTIPFLALAPAMTKGHVSWGGPTLLGAALLAAAAGFISHRAAPTAPTAPTAPQAA